MQSVRAGNILRLILHYSKPATVRFTLLSNKDRRSTAAEGSKELDLEEKTKYMSMCHHQNAGRYHDIMVVNYMEMI
jgi:hypothetical protein